MPLTYTDSLTVTATGGVVSRRKLTAITMVAALHVVMFYAFTHGMSIGQVFKADPPLVMVNTPTPPKPIEQSPRVPAESIDRLQPVYMDSPVNEPQLFVAPDIAPPVETSNYKDFVGEPTGVGPRVDPVDNTLTITQRIDPVYPAAARRAGEQGTVVLSVMVDADGRVSAVTVASSSGSMELDDAAIAAIKRWQFNKRSGGTQQVRVPISFKLNTVRF